ncbi:hypothetical protein K502DRAFT_353602 [Neoconidiobolus thromboides FSU 785]|nr:hypothetical protein K502DRAFT_353602 [Neoconidiobolus thromboides FSU 785]
MDKCIAQQSESINSYCQSGSLENYECFCERLPNLIGCYANCPNDLMSLGRKAEIEQQMASYCSGVNNNMSGDNFFQVAKASGSVIIQAGATQIIVPTNGLSQDTNTPIVGSLYNSYTLGSLSVGYKTNSGISSASNAFKLLVNTNYYYGVFFIFFLIQITNL